MKRNLDPLTQPGAGKSRRAQTADAIGKYHQPLFLKDDKSLNIINSSFFAKNCRSFKNFRKI